MSNHPTNQDILDAINAHRRSTDQNFVIIDRKFKGIDKKFEGIDKKFDGINRKFDGIDKKFDGVDKQFGGIDGKFEGIDGKFAKLDEKLNNVIYLAVQNQQTLRMLVTCDEFDDFKDMVFTRFDELSGHYERLDENLTCFGAQQDCNTKSIRQLQAA